ncbi:MAG: C39 family peptidase [Spiroplasma phoeniceum]|nr:MAG: C39 family peptidase [Spiroplasma phoeniceum]UZQ33315.1 MAG: C39 family peptidase [Spiroplasma phoeniceum]
MKKLLSLLSVLTISGSAIPTTIAASPYQKEENIKNNDINNDINYKQINNLEILNRYKRQNNNNSNHLNVQSVKQEGTQYCGPASVETVLRYFGLNTNNLLNTVNQERPHQYASFQQYLADLFQTHNVENQNQGIGTSPSNLLTPLNNLILDNNLNNQRLYSSTWLTYNSLINTRQFQSLVQTSLENNTPVISGFSSINPWNNTSYNHYIVITGYQFSHYFDQNNTQPIYDFTYMDPADGNYYTIDSFGLHTLFLRRNLNHIFSYNPNPAIQTQIPDPIQIEPMQTLISDFNLLDLSGNICSVCAVDKLNKIVKRDINEFCLNPEISNPIYDENDIINGYYSNITTINTSLKISRKTSVGIINFFSNNNLNNFKIYLKNLFENIKWENKVWGGTKESDISHLTDYIIKNYSYFHNKTIELTKNKNYNKIEIVINDEKKYDNDPTKYIYLV